MVGPLPGRFLVLERYQLYPVHGHEVERTDRVESLSVGPTTPEEQQLAIDRIVAERAVRSGRRHISVSFYFFPFSLSQGVDPEVVHVLRI